MNRTITAGILSASVYFGVTLAEATPIESQKHQPDTNPVVTRLVLRNRTVTITAAPDGLRYTVGVPSGDLLHSALTESELEKHHPRLSRTLRPAIARDKPILMMWAPIRNFREPVTSLGEKLDY